MKAWLIVACCARACGYHVTPNAATELARGTAAATSRQSLLQAAWPDLRLNMARHQQELDEAANMGYHRSRLWPDPSWTPPSVLAYDVPRAATGLGPVCPFASYAQPNRAQLPLVFQTTTPLLSADECQVAIDEARAHIARSGDASDSGFSYTDTSRNVAVSDLPRTLAWLNSDGCTRVAGMTSRCFGEAVGDPSQLRLYRALVVHYDATQGLTHQTVHRDHSLITVVITLNDQREYSGGGTFVEALGSSFSLPRGHALLQASALRHAGHFIESGERWVMVLFLNNEKLRWGEHVRHFKARATRHLVEGDHEAVTHCLTLARTMCADSDPELLDSDARLL